MASYNPKKNKGHWILCSARTSLDSLHYLLKHLVNKNYNKIKYTELQKLLLKDLPHNPKVSINSLVGARQHIKALEHLGLVNKYKGKDNKDVFELSKTSMFFIKKPVEIYTNCFFKIEFNKNNYKSEVDPSFNIDPGLFILSILFYLEKYHGAKHSYLTNNDFSRYLIFAKEHGEVVSMGEAISGSHKTSKYPKFPSRESPQTYKNHGGWIKALIKNTKYIEDFPSIRGAIKLNYKTIINDGSDIRSLNHNLACKILNLFNYADFKFTEYQNEKELEILEKINKIPEKNIKGIIDDFRKRSKEKKTISATRNYIPMSPVLKAAVKKIANFTCQACGKFSFKDKKGYGYCEPHHIITRAEGGEVDNPDNIVVLCPLCHAKIHHGDKKIKLDTYNMLLKKGHIKLKYFIELSNSKKITFEQLRFSKKEGIISLKELNKLHKIYES